MGLTPAHCVLRGQCCALSKFVPDEFVERGPSPHSLSQKQKARHEAGFRYVTDWDCSPRPWGSPLCTSCSGASALRCPVVPGKFVERGPSPHPLNQKQKARHEAGFRYVTDGDCSPHPWGSLLRTACSGASAARCPNSFQTNLSNEVRVLTLSAKNKKPAMRRAFVT